MLWSATKLNDESCCNVALVKLLMVKERVGAVGSDADAPACKLLLIILDTMNPKPQQIFLECSFSHLPGLVDVTLGCHAFQTERSVSLWMLRRPCPVDFFLCKYRFTTLTRLEIMEEVSVTDALHCKIAEDALEKELQFIKKAASLRRAQRRQRQGGARAGRGTPGRRYDVVSVRGHRVAFADHKTPLNVWLIAS